MEKRLLAEYETDLDRIAEALSPGRIDAAVALASVPSLIRGFGHVKSANAAKAAGERERCLTFLAESGKAEMLKPAA